MVVLLIIIVNNLLPWIDLTNLFRSFQVNLGVTQFLKIKELIFTLLY